MPSVYSFRLSYPASAVKITRGTSWGNPFIIGKDGDREQVIKMFEQYAEWRLSIQPHWLDELRGKDLVCWCVPLKCHGDILVKLANR